MTYYVLDENNNKVPAYSKEEVLAVLAQAIEDGTLENIVADAAFVSKLKCCVGGDTHNMAFVTQAKYNELVAAGQLKENTYYWITDDTTGEDLDETLDALTAAVNGLIDAINGLDEKNVKHQRFTFANEDQSIGFTSKENSLIKRTQDSVNTSAWLTSPQNIPISLLDGRSLDEVVGISGTIAMYTMLNQAKKQYIHFQAFSRNSNGVWLSNVIFIEGNTICCGEFNFNLTSSTLALEEIKQYIESDKGKESYLDLLLTELNIFYK